jgi:DNA repair exonuclease SbcCD ATPase subunit
MYKEKNKNYKMHECSICLENLFREVTCALKCGHVFHYQCIKNQEDLLPRNQEGNPDYQNYQCPLCRTPINPWNGDIIMLNGMIETGVTNIANLEYGMEIISNFEVKNITILNQRLKFYLADLQNVKKEIEAGNKELQNLNTIKAKIYEEVQKTSEGFKKDMLKFAEKSKKEILKLKEDRDKIEKEGKILMKKMEKDEKVMKEKMEKDEKKMKEDIASKMKKMKENFQSELDTLAEKRLEEVNKEKERLEDIVRKRTEEGIKDYIIKFKEEEKERKKISKKYDILQKNINRLIIKEDNNI